MKFCLSKQYLLVFTVPFLCVTSKIYIVLPIYENGTDNLSNSWEESKQVGDLFKFFSGTSWYSWYSTTLMFCTLYEQNNLQKKRTFQHFNISPLIHSFPVNLESGQDGGRLNRVFQLLLRDPEEFTGQKNHVVLQRVLHIPQGLLVRCA